MGKEVAGRQAGYGGGSGKKQCGGSWWGAVKRQAVKKAGGVEARAGQAASPPPNPRLSSPCACLPAALGCPHFSVSLLPHIFPVPLLPPYSFGLPSTFPPPFPPLTASACSTLPLPPLSPYSRFHPHSRLPRLLPCTYSKMRSFPPPMLNGEKHLFLESNKYGTLVAQW